VRIVRFCPPERFRQVLEYLDAKAYPNHTLREYTQAGSREASPKGRPVVTDALFEQPPSAVGRQRKRR